MIYGHESLYERYDNKLNTEFFLSENLVHDIQPAGQRFSLGLTATETYVGLVEDKIGKDVYKKYYQMQNLYSELCDITNQYKKEKKIYDDLSKKIKDLKFSIDVKEKEIAKYETERKKLVEKQNVSSDEEKKIEQLSNNLYEIKINLQEYIKASKVIESKLEHQKNISAAYLTRINRVKEVLSKKLESIEELEGCFDLFKDGKFEKDIEQDFIDGTLLPGEEKVEEDFRSIAKSRYCVLKLEAIYLDKIKEYSANLLKNLEVTDNCKQLVDIKLSKHVVKDRMQAKGLEILSQGTLGLGGDYFLNDTAIAKFFTYVYDQTIKTQFAENTNMEYSNILATANKKFNIPTNEELKGFSGMFNKILHKYSTFYHVESLDWIYQGVGYLHKAQDISINKEQNVEQNNEL